MKHFLRGISLTIVLTSFLVCPTATDKSKGEGRIVGIVEDDIRKKSIQHQWCSFEQQIENECGNRPAEFSGQ